MLTTLLTLIGTVLLLTFVTSYMILRVAVPEPFRKMMLFFVVTTPFVAIIAFIRVLFSHPKPPRYNEELGRIEDEIESERTRTFGGKITRFSERWKLSYLYALEKTAAAAKLDPSLNRSLCGTARLR